MKKSSRVADACDLLENNLRLECEETVNGLWCVSVDMITKIPLRGFSREMNGCFVVW